MVFMCSCSGGGMFFYIGILSYRFGFICFDFLCFEKEKIKFGEQGGEDNLEGRGRGAHQKIH